MFSRFIIALCLSALSLSLYATQYKTSNNLCDGLTQLPVGTLPNTCLGLLADAQLGAAFEKPRKAIQIPDTYQILVTDMGNWNPNQGSLWLLDFSAEQSFKGEFKATKLMTGLNLPHDIKVDEHNNIYLGEADQITRFNLVNNLVTNQETIIHDLPYIKDKYRHPLTAFIFLQNKDLLINVGSQSDNCVSEIKKDNCDTLNEVGLRLYTYEQSTKSWSAQYQMYATGLRNSMAIVQHDSGTILQGENSSDISQAEEPYEEINIVKQNAFYGWPYCLNRRFDQKIIENGCEVENYNEPYSLMPPHTAPLDMMYYNGDLLPELTGKLLMGWHGYRVVGNRVVAYSVDKNGLPILTKTPSFNRDPYGDFKTFTEYNFAPEGGSEQDAQAQEIISHWNTVEGLRPEGAPVGLAQLSDGSIIIVDDKNNNIVRLSKGESYQQEDVVVQKKETKIELSVETKELLVFHCSSCHQELKTDITQLLNDQQWLKPIIEGSLSRSLLETKLSSGSMPPSGKLSSVIITEILSGIKQVEN